MSVTSTVPFITRLQAVCDNYKKNPIDAERAAMTLLCEGVEHNLIDATAKEILSKTTIAANTPFSHQYNLATSTLVDKEIQLIWMRSNQEKYLKDYPTSDTEANHQIEMAEKAIRPTSDTPSDCSEPESSEPGSSEISSPPPSPSTSEEFVDVDADQYTEFLPEVDVELLKVAYERALETAKNCYFSKEEAKGKAQLALNAYLESLIALDTKKFDHYIALAKFVCPDGFTLPQSYNRAEYEKWINTTATQLMGAATTIGNRLKNNANSISNEEWSEQVSSLANSADKLTLAGENAAAVHIHKILYEIPVPKGITAPEAKNSLALIKKVANLDPSEGKELMTTHLRKGVAAAFIDRASHFIKAMRLAKTLWQEEYLTAEMHFYEALLVEAPGKGFDRDLDKFEEHINKAIAKAPNVYLYYEYPYKVFHGNDEDKAMSYLLRSTPRFNAAFTLSLGDQADVFLDRRDDPKNYMEGKEEYQYLQQLLSGAEA